uniref:Probable serine/threonine-protein kinase DDB_G0282963 n=1 Tax=Dermatophagoides pteronyssinus TaxID=6956 RepID=A0A6P6XNT2_DERPT|nr:probable serine/threonine-protein kinase DDB_G0282963 [Dermatophagoides pteronyssinus]
MTKNSSSTTTATKNLQSISTLFATTSSSTSTSSSLSTSSPLPSRFSSFANLTNNNAGQQSNNNVSAAAVNHQSSINTGKTTLLPSFYYPNVKHHDQQQQQQQQQMKQMGNSLKINDSDDLFDNSNRSFHHHRQQQQQQQYNNGDSSMISLINSTNNNDNGDGHDPTSVHLNGNSGSTVLSATSPTTNGTTSTYTSMTTTTDNSIHRLIDNNIPHQHQQQQQQQKCAINTLCNNSNLIGFDNNGGSVGVSSMILSPLDVSINATAADSYSFLKQSFNNHGLSYQKSGSQLKLNILNDSFVDHHHHHHNRHQQQQRINNSAFDLRWSSVIGPVLFCFAFNHGPFLVFNLLAIFIPGIWTPFHDLILVALSLFEALLLPLIIFISNETFRDAFTRSCCHCGSHHSHRSHRHHHHHHSIHDKISSICSSNKSSLTFTVTSTTTTTNDNNTVERNVMQSQMLPPPSYPLLTSSSASKTSSNSSTSTSSSSTSTDNKHQTPINTFLTSYHSDLDLLKKCSKIDQSSNKLNDCSGGKISFQKHLQHNNNNYNNNNGDMNRKLHQATSMLDLSLSSRNAYHNYYLHHHNHPNNSQQQQQRNSHYQQQQSQNHHHASRSRYSLALTSQQQQQSQTNNYDSLLLTPKPSFNHRRQQQRPPSVASCHYLFSNQSANQQQQQSKCGRYYGQFMFGSSILMPKSESTLSVPLNVSSSESFNRFGSSTPTTTSVIPNNYQHHHHNQQMISSNKKEFVPGGSNKLFNHGKCSPISINLNKFDSSTNVTINNMPISNDEMSTDIGYNNNDFYHEKDSNAAAIKSGRSATKLFDNIINGITGRSRSVRKSDSDASTFYNRHNLKRSQIAQNQLSNILYNNFYNKKLASSAFGSEIILLSDNEQQQQKHRNSPLFGRRMANDHKNQNRFDHIDIHHNRLKSSNKQQQQPQQCGQFPRPHVYLPSVSSLQETNTRSNSCQQLSILNGDADHYHNHLLLKQNLSSLIDESAPLISCEYEQQQQQPQSNDKKHHIRNSDDFNKNNSIADARDGSGEPIYASLPNEEEQVKHDDDMNGDDEIKASGSFSARSTLPDNCQLISVYAHASNNDDELVHQRQRQKSNILHNVNENLNLKCFRDNDNNEFDNDNDVDNGNISSNSSNSSSSTVGESSEDIYEEVGHLARSNIHPNNDDLNDFELNHDNNNKRQRSASQDTLIEQNNDPFNLEQQQQQQSNLNSNHNNDNDNNNDDDDDEDMSDGDDQTLPTADDLDEDQISILSGTSSSTFSSFTTCANQDFEFIVSQQLTDMTTKQQTISSSKSQNHKSNVESVIKSNVTNNQMADLRNLKSDLENFLIEKPSLEPSTLSMAAMYYNRLILNSDSDNAKSGHRQRTKLNRRQSFSTAHELRQRILYNQLNNNNENQMGLIEEENDDHNNHHDNGSINEYSMFTTNFSEIFPFKLDRRISSSEDNLLSIISTIANCGDDNNAEFESPDSNFIQTNVLKENLTNENDENVKIIDHSNGTFIMKRDLNLKNKSAIPRATAHSNASNETLKITIKELKSKKQAQKRTSKSNLNSNQKSKSSLLASNNGNRVYELGSLWERQSSSKFNKESTNSSILKSSSNIPSSSSSSSVTKQNFSQNKFKSTKTSTTTSPSPSSSPSSSSSSSRVSTFITVSPLRTPKHQTNFTSKLLPPSDYVVKQPKQDARQNAILAKNALLMSGIKTPIIKLPLQSQPPMDLHP